MKQPEASLKNTNLLDAFNVSAFYSYFGNACFYPSFLSITYKKKKDEIARLKRGKSLFLIFFCRFLNPNIFFFNLNYNYSNLLALTNLQIKKKSILLPKIVLPCPKLIMIEEK